MPAVLSLPAAYGYVVADVCATFIMNLYMGITVGTSRKKYDVPYPLAYAPENAKDPKKANLFNCTQRAHQNTLEGMPLFLATLLIGGMQHPTVAAPLGLGWIGGRVLYFEKYRTGEPKARAMGGGLSFLSQIGLFGCTVSAALNLLGVL